MLLKTSLADESAFAMLVFFSVYVTESVALKLVPKVKKERSNLSFMYRFSFSFDRMDETFSV